MTAGTAWEPGAAALPAPGWLQLMGRSAASAEAATLLPALPGLSLPHRAPRLAHLARAPPPSFTSHLPNSLPTMHRGKQGTARHSAGLALLARLVLLSHSVPGFPMWVAVSIGASSCPAWGAVPWITMFSKTLA